MGAQGGVVRGSVERRRGGSGGGLLTTGGADAKGGTAGGRRRGDTRAQGHAAVRGGGGQRAGSHHSVHRRHRHGNHLATRECDGRLSGEGCGRRSCCGRDWAELGGGLEGRALGSVAPAPGVAEPGGHTSLWDTWIRNASATSFSLPIPATRTATVRLTSVHTHCKKLSLLLVLDGTGATAASLKMISYDVANVIPRARRLWVNHGQLGSGGGSAGPRRPQGRSAGKV